MAEHDRDIDLRDQESPDGADSYHMKKNQALTRAKKRHAFLCVQTRRLPEARALYAEICRRDPQDRHAWFMLGSVCGRLGDGAAAESALRTALDLAPETPQVLLNLGYTLEQQRRYAEAEDLYLRVLKVKAESSETHEALGRVLELRGEIESAVRHYRQVIRIKPTRAKAYHAAARLLRRQGRLKEAGLLLEQRLDDSPEDADAVQALAEVYLETGHLDTALAHACLAGHLKLGDNTALALEASILLAMGRAAAARQMLAPVLEQYINVPELALVDARLSLHEGDVQAAVGRLETLLSRGAVNRAHAARAHHCLGELYDAQGRYDEAFAHFAQAKGAHSPAFDRAAWARRIDAIITHYSAETLARAPRAGNCSERPVFLVGMPHSGIEQVRRLLCASPGVVGLGENRVVASLAMECEISCASLPGGQGLTQLGREQCDDFARRYLDSLEQAAPEAKRVVDTMADNCIHLGLISLLFPLAHIIHCVREPMDSCLATYFAELDDSYVYARELGDLGFYHHQYQRLMHHWTRALGLPILELSYEALQSMPAQVARELFKFCGLKALSLDLPQGGDGERGHPQGHWRHYQHHLEALRRGLSGES